MRDEENDRPAWGKRDPLEVEAKVQRQEELMASLCLAWQRPCDVCGHGFQPLETACGDTGGGWYHQRCAHLAKPKPEKVITDIVECGWFDQHGGYGIQIIKNDNS